MKSFDCFYEEMISLPNLYNAYFTALKGTRLKRHKDFSEDLHQNLEKLHLELAFFSYSPKGYKTFFVDDYKRRKIMAPNFRDHVVHHAIYLYLNQMYEPNFISDSYACRIGKGTHKAFFKARKMLRRNHDKYFLKCDITKYFYSIDHFVLIRILSKKIKDPKVLWLLWKIIQSHNEPFNDYHLKNKFQDFQMKGIPIGNLTSQLFANVYLNELDYFIKFHQKQKYYIRYVDDFLLFGDKSFLKSLLDEITLFLRTVLFLDLSNKKVEMNKVVFGVDFLGFVLYKNLIRVRTMNFKRFKQRISRRIYFSKQGLIGSKKIKQAFVSYNSHLNFSNSEKIKKDLRIFYSKAFKKHNKQ